MLELWNAEYPEKLSYHDLGEFNSYLKTLNDLAHLLLLDEKDKIKGWAFSFKKESERWFGIIVSEALHGHGLGSKMLDKLKHRNHELNGWVIDKNNTSKTNDEPYKSPLEFYQKNEFEILKTERLELDKISALKINWRKK